jgi:hypothetical protein
LFPLQEWRNYQGFSYLEGMILQVKTGTFILEHLSMIRHE